MEAITVTQQTHPQAEAMISNRLTTFPQLPCFRASGSLSKSGGGPDFALFFRIAPTPSNGANRYFFV
jgi:hypothetical protein